MSKPIVDHLPDRIYRIRGQQVMLDSDLAALYGVPTFRLNEQVKRNKHRFPPDFMFQVSPDEWERLISQNARSNSGRGGRRHRPFAFTEHGVAMLSSVLGSERAIEVNIAIIRAFVRLRHALGAHRDLARRIEKIEGRLDLHDTDIRLIVQDLQQRDNIAQPPIKEPRPIRGFSKD